MNTIDSIRENIRKHNLAPEGKVLSSLLKAANLDKGKRKKISAAAAELVQQIRDDTDPTIMENFLADHDKPAHARYQLR